MRWPCMMCVHITRLRHLKNTACMSTTTQVLILVELGVKTLFILGRIKLYQLATYCTALVAVASYMYIASVYNTEH